MPQLFLTIVIPAYNEEKRLPGSLEKIGNFLREQPYRSEVLVVENGSTDGTSDVVRDFASTVAANDPFTVELLHSAQGKGAAVKTGMLVGKGAYLFICDADLSMPIEEVSKFLPPALAAGSFDVAIASREIPGAVRYNEPGYRHLMGRVFNLIVRTLIIPGIEDTQCGFKLFTQAAANEIFPYQTINGWGFDPEAAKQAIADSSYGSVENLPPITLTFSDTPRNRTRNEWLAAKFAEVLGVEAKLDPVESTTYTALTKDINTAPQMFILGWCADYPDPQNWLSVYWKTGAFGDRIGYANPDLDALLNSADTELDPAKRAELYAQGQQLLTDGAPVAFMWNNVNAYMVKPWVTGLVKTPQDSGWPGDIAPWTVDIDTAMQSK